MNTKLKKLTVCALTLATFSSSTVSTFAWFWNKVDASDHWVTKTSYGSAYASGFTTSDKEHYTNVQLYAGNQMRESGRVWGSGQVDASTDSAPYVENQTHSAVFYGF
ncbi:hypothetical protein CP523_15810 (plasmid) [Clostridium septicum]|uniref:Lactococcin 972 family bacteriocin n=1 Tax=Clostridium septicum TaxID=1504 RepID=A0A9N7JP93_CLOSE|nr:hypothetical protein [Clostridium septicum]AYE35899.1 hypothetical protein CP523_15810 [Clostridium septicum]USS02546.1 hypothetical protein NH397_16015 [Clostridium septicum]